MANQVIVTNTGNVQVALTPPANVQVQISRAAIGTVSNVPTANFANYAANVTASNQPNITNVGTLGNLSVTNTVTANNVNTNTVFYNGTGVAIQSNAWAQLQYTNSAVAPVSQYDIGTGSWFFVDNTGAVWQSNTTGTVKTVTLGNNGNINADGNVTAPYFIGNGSQLTGIVATGGNANYANFAGNVTGANQPNITNVGTLGNLSVSSNATIGNLTVLGNLAVGNLVANNANYANFAGEAFNVNAANITGTVANANFAAYSEQANNANLATFATTANAVALANVSGAGNIASINLDGNVANLLTGNGTFVAIPTVSANANYANFAGQVVDNTQSNITALGTLANLSVTGNIDTQNNVTALKYYAATGGDEFSGYGFVGASNSNTAMCMTATDEITFYNNAIETLSLYANNNAKFYANLQANYYFGDGSQLSNINGGNVSNVANANYANFAGTAYSVDGANVSGTVANANFAAYSEQANNANLATFATTANAVAGANVSGEVANANYASYANIANTANSVNVANVVGIGNIATTNYDGNSGNILYGNGGFFALPIINSVANSNYANFAGQVVDATQANITGLGNLMNLNVTGNIANNTTFQFVPTGTNVGVSGQNAASYIVNQFTTQPGTSNSQVLNFQFNASRGNSTNPANVANADYIGRMAWNSYNGNTYIRNALITVLAPQGGNASQQGANVAWGAGSFFINTGNPLGNITSNTTATTQNLLGMTPFGALTLTPGTPGPNNAVQNALTLQSYGSNTDGAGGIVNRILFQRSRGNRDGSLAVANADGVGSFTMTAYNGNGYVGSASMYGIVNTTYGNISAGNTVPIELNFSLSNGNGTISTTSFKPDGNVIFPTGKTVTAGAFSGDGTNVTNVSATLSNTANYAGNVTVNAQPNITSLGNLTTLTINNGNVELPTQQFNPNGVNIGSTANTNLFANSYSVTMDYGNGQGDGNLLLPKATSVLKARGNATSMTTGNVNDRISRTNYLIYNGSANALAVATQVNPFSAFNANANAVTTAGQYQIITGNPNGDQGNANALSNQNLHQFDPFGRLTITQGAAGSTSAIVALNTYGGSSGNANTLAQQIVFQRLRGSRDGNLSVQPSDQMGGILFTGYNGTSQFATRNPFIRGVVDSTYVANTTAIPAGLSFGTCDNTTQFTHSFHANGNVTFNSGKTVTAGFFIGDGASISNVANANFASFANSYTGNTINSGQISLTTTAPGVPSLTLTGIQGSSNSQLTINQGTFNVFNQDLLGGQSPFNFNISGNTALQEPINYFRSRGTKVSPANVVAGDTMMNQRWQVYANSAVYDAFNVQTSYQGFTAGLGPYCQYNFSSSGDSANTVINFSSGTINFNGNITLGNSTGNTSIQSSSFFKLSVYTKAALTAITGTVGQMACVSDSASGGNPNGMMAFWDTTHSRWSYVHDNNAV